MTAAVSSSADPVAWLRAHAPWLFAPELGVCIVGSSALAIACAQAGEHGPRVRDLDLSWAPDVAAGRALLERQQVFVPTTDGSVQRGTLALKVGGKRLEITTLRASSPTAPLAERVLKDLGARDMTIGAIALQLADGSLHDPFGGREHWRARRIVAVGDAGERVREHPVRWLRYYRKAHELGFEIDRGIRRIALSPHVLDTVPPEAIAGELRAALLQCASPGRFFVDLHEVGVLAWLAPELDLQFDGRPAGPQRWHPELSQALHIVLALEWAVQHGQQLDERDRLAMLLAVLLHDLGKGFTAPDDLPGHPGHERRGLPYVDAFAQRFAGLLDQRGYSLVCDVCALHVDIRALHDLRAGTLAKLYDRHFRARDYPVEAFALAVAADSGGRLGLADSGHRTLAQLRIDLQWLRSRCESVDAQALRQQHADVTAFKAALHEARARALAEGPPRGKPK